MDRQLIFFLIQDIFLGILDKIDNGFGNHIDVDSICVLNSYTVLTWLVESLYNVGTLAFRADESNAKLKLAIQEIWSICIGIIEFIFADKIILMYGLSDIQNQMFIKCIKIHALSSPIFALWYFLSKYAELKCLNKQAAIGNVLLYSVMILSDIYVVTLGSNTLVELVAWTTVSILIYDLYMILSTKIMRERAIVSVKAIKKAVIPGLHLSFSNITGKVCAWYFGILASNLSTMEYAIHCICYDVMDFGEYITWSLNSYLTVKTRERIIRNSKNKADTSCYKGAWEYCRKLSKQNIPKLLLVMIVSSATLLIVMHGAVPINLCISWCIIYCTQGLVFFFYETSSAYLVVTSNTKMMAIDGVIGFIVRMLVVLIGTKLGLGSIPFAIACTSDYLARTIYLYNRASYFDSNL